MAKDRGGKLGNEAPKLTADDSQHDGSFLPYCTSWGVPNTYLGSKCQTRRDVLRHQSTSQATPVVGSQGAQEMRAAPETCGAVLGSSWPFSRSAPRGDTPRGQTRPLYRPGRRVAVSSAAGGAMR